MKGFLIKAALMFLGWFAIENLLLANECNPINDFLTLNVAVVSGWVVSLFGYESIGLAYQKCVNLVVVGGVPLVRIESGCNGLVLMVLFAGFVIAYPGSIKHKLWYIPAGIFLIYWANILRVVVLVFNHLYSKSTFDFNHKYTYAIALYAIIFGLWMLWANKLAKFEGEEGNGDSPQSEPQVS